jgi:hypothetical protein
MSRNHVPIIAVNASIWLKQQASSGGKTGKYPYNFYQWLREVQKGYRPDLSLKNLWLQVCLAATTETSCYSQCQF